MGTVHFSVGTNAPISGRGTQRRYPPLVILRSTSANHIAADTELGVQSDVLSEIELSLGRPDAQVRIVGDFERTPGAAVILTKFCPSRTGSSLGGIDPRRSGTSPQD